MKGLKEEYVIGDFIMKTVIIAVLAILGIALLLKGLDNFVDRNLNKITEQADKLLLGENGMFNCNIRYKEVSYSGLCGDAIINDFRDMIDADYQLQFIKQCSENQFSYAICKKYLNLNGVGITIN